MLVLASFHLGSLSISLKYSERLMSRRLSMKRPCRLCRLQKGEERGSQRSYKKVTSLLSKRRGPWESWNVTCVTSWLKSKARMLSPKASRGIGSFSLPTTKTFFSEFSQPRSTCKLLVGRIEPKRQVSSLF